MVFRYTDRNSTWEELWIFETLAIVFVMVSGVFTGQVVARSKTLKPTIWQNIRTVAPEVRDWRRQETISYIVRIEAYLARMDDNGRIVK